MPHLFITLNTKGLIVSCYKAMGVPRRLFHLQQLRASLLVERIIINNHGLIAEGSDSFLELECHLQSSGQVVASQQIEIADLQSLCRMLSRVGYI